MMSEAMNERLERIERLLLIAAKNVFNVAEVAVLLDCTKDNVYHLANSNAIPYYKQGKHLYFKRAEIEQWQTQNRIASNTDLQTQANTYVKTHKRK